MVLVHQMYYHFSEYPLSLRLVFTGTLVVLGIGYVFAMLQVFNAHAGRDGNPMLSAKDLEIAYSGSESTKLEAALIGPMSDMIETEDREIIVNWVQNDADEDVYDTKVATVIDDNCLGCHDGSNPHLPTLDSYENVTKLTQKDEGTDIFTLIRVSHIHLFGITFIFFIMGQIFSHAFMRPVWLKGAIVLTPFIAIIIDIGSWYVTKFFPPFAWVVIGSGALMGLSFATMWIISFYQIWFMQLPGYAIKESIVEHSLDRRREPREEE